MNREALESLDKETPIHMGLAQAWTISALPRQIAFPTIRVGELEGNLGLPPARPLQNVAGFERTTRQPGG